jgi:hypothetical protein
VGVAGQGDRAVARASPSSAAATASAPLPSSCAASRRYSRSAASTWSLRERPACSRPPAAPMRSVRRVLDRRLAILWSSSKCASRRARAPAPMSCSASRMAPEIARRQQALRLQHLGVRDRGAMS